MARDTSLSSKPALNAAKGVPLRSTLLFSLLLIIVCVTAVSLRIVDAHIHSQINQSSRLQFRRSLQTFTDAESQRLLELERENALLADLPSLKALMTTADDRTIEDGGARFMRVGGNDLFALANSTGHIAAAYSRKGSADVSLRRSLEAAVADTSERRYLVDGTHLFGYSVRPLFFGDETRGTLLGYVITGYAVDAGLLRTLAEGSGLDVVFLSGENVLASTLPAGLAHLTALRDEPPGAIASIRLAGQPFTAVSRDLSAEATAPLHLLLLRSMRQDEADAEQIDRLLLLIGFFTALAGTGLMLLVSAGTTHSLRALAAGVEAFGGGDPNSRLPERGPREVRQLSVAFAAMRQRVEDTNRALLEAERLATIGRMARSVSHDLRHHLSAVYANAEFLASAHLTAAERAEFFEEIRAAVLGTTEMIESLLLFSRTGQPATRKLRDLDTIVRHAAELIHLHPEAQGIQLRIESSAGVVFAVCDSKQVERAVCNLLLNAAQAAGQFAREPLVVLSVVPEKKLVAIRILDNGAGVPDSVRERLFQPFVSEGKQSGTGLGLTLAHQVARDHDGELVLEHSAPGATCFRFSILCAKLSSPEDPRAAMQAESVQVRGPV